MHTNTVRWSTSIARLSPDNDWAVTINDLLRKLSRSIVVRRPGNDDRDAMRGPVAVGQPVRARLARRVRIAWLDFVGLGARTALDAAIHLVGGDLDKSAESGRLAGGVEQHEAAIHVGVRRIYGQWRFHQSF